MPSSLDVRLARLAELHPRSIDLSLERIQRLLGQLGHPERNLGRVVHVAGTNGKGSVVAMLAAVQRAAGRTVNAYVSPHLLHFNERMLIDGKPIKDEPLVAVLDAAEEANAGAPITFFEITTAAAFLVFSARPAEITILETGLGGRLDATNVIERPALTVITPVGLDHCDRLGGTLSEIAAEKAGILKEGVPVVVGRQRPAAMGVITKRARALRAPLLRYGAEWCLERDVTAARYVDSAGRRIELPTALQGAHQKENAAVVAACIAATPDLAVPEEAAIRGFERVRWPGRLQRLRKGRLVGIAAPLELWLDTGHNPDSAQVLADWGSEGPPLRLIVGLLKSKDPASFFRPFCGVAGGVATVSLGSNAVGWDPDELAAVAKSVGLCASPFDSLEAAVRWAGEAVTRHRILMTGSFLLAGQVLRGTGPSEFGIGF
ncbi:MAG: bifunctional folylpolyglutamate synthase/dihydrofolate synthase [Rhodospirillales bacterium]|nr:bifunctional folylpolyglutamate synthase/dihydrofolate synthase [Rhodospirillales bacterium]